MKTFKFEKLKKCRDEVGKSQESVVIDLAFMGLRTTRGTLSAWELGKSSPSVVEIPFIAEYYKKRIEYFFT